MLEEVDLLVDCGLNDGLDFASVPLKGLLQLPQVPLERFSQPRQLVTLLVSVELLDLLRVNRDKRL